MNKSTQRIRIKDIARITGLSVGTVDRVLHKRSGVSEVSRKKVEEVLLQLDYQPNMYASALASNKRYHFACLLPQHSPHEYWTDVESGIDKAIKTFSDFNIQLSIFYYDPYSCSSFTESGQDMLNIQLDGVILAPTLSDTTSVFTQLLEERNIPYIFIDSHIPSLHPLAFYGQKADQSGYLAARMLMMLGENPNHIAIFRQMKKGEVGSNQQKNREKGFRKYMQEHHPYCTIHVVDMDVMHTDENYRLLDHFFETHPEVKCGITFSSKVYMIGEYLLERHKEKNIRLLGYDLLKRNIHCLKSEAIDILIAQQPTAQGYKSVESLCNNLIFKKPVEQCNYMPISLLTKENVDFYLEYIENKI